MSGDVEEIITAGKVNDSLFSLEVIVEKLTAPSIVCRFPAVAFRLLDFPTLIIYHVEHDLAETIKSKVQCDPQYRVPPQFHELKDRKNYFIVKKGKSCLFKISPQNLHAHLMNTPLYVMLIDTYPEVPKLLANCSIPLDDIMDLIYKDINHLGVSVPSAHGQKGEYKLFNLMGVEVGEISLGFRLLSLGMGLMQHMPETAVSTYIPNTASSSRQNISQPKPKAQQEERIKAVDRTTEKILQSIEAADKTVQAAISDFVPKMEDMDTQTEEEIRSARKMNSSIQTDRQERRKKAKPHHKRQEATLDPYTKVSNEINNFFVTNMTCPPPLFYNSEAQDPMLLESLTFNDNIFQGTQVPTPNYAWGEEEDSTESFSSDDTIRYEDKYSDSDVEIEYDFAESKVVHKESKTAAQRRAKAKAMNVSNMELANRAGNVMNAMQQGGMGVPRLQQLPLLNALITEIMALQGINAGQLQHPDLIHEQIKEKPPRPVSAPSPKRETKQEREERLKKLATPRNASKKPEEIHSHRECANRGKPVPKDKSWTKKDPKLSKPVKTTALSFGITKAQRLRLEKTNPALLRKLEAEHEERMKNCVEKTKAKYLQYKKETEMGDRLMQSARSVGKKTPREADQSKLQSTMESTGDPLTEMSKQHRRPVPTPRRSLSLHNGQVKDAIKALAGREFGTPEEWTSMHYEEHSITGPAIDENGSLYSQRSARSQPSQHSGDIQLPSMSDYADESMNNDVHPTENNYKRASPKPRMPRIPGFGGTQVISKQNIPASVDNAPTSSRPESRATDYGNYSESFEDASQSKNNGYWSAEEPSLRRIVDHYSDYDYGSDGQSNPLAVSGEEPSLRKIIDQYSDDSTDLENDGYITAVTPKSDDSDGPLSLLHDNSGPRLKIPSAMPSPMASVHSPITAMRPVIPPTREGMAASSTPTETDRVSNESTAYIRESQMPTMSETGYSEDMGEDGRRSATSGVLIPKPSPRRKFDRLSSIHTDSVSSYAPSDEGADADFSSRSEEVESYSQSFEDSEDSGPAPVSVVKQMSDLRLAPEAKMGYTWGGYSKK